MKFGGLSPTKFPIEIYIIWCQENFYQGMDWTCKQFGITLSSSAWTNTHLNRSKVTTVATIPMRERPTPIMLSVSSTVSSSGDAIQSWNLEQISWKTRVIWFKFKLYKCLLSHRSANHKDCKVGEMVAIACHYTSIYIPIGLTSFHCPLCNDTINAHLYMT